jgi:predicted transglutaminase-like cysteine proteinase
MTAAFGEAARNNVTLATVAKVNSWTNSRIRYVEDRDLYGRPDYWAPASRTLKSRAGDCEDIAIVKMQLLAAIGANRSDMYLTIVRDLVRNADHAVLIVKLNGRHYLLDNSTDRLLDASQANDYRPIFSYANGRKWLHGVTTVASKADTQEVAEPARISLLALANSQKAPFIEPAASY